MRLSQSLTLEENLSLTIFTSNYLLLLWLLSLSLNMSQLNNSHLIKYFSNHRHMYSLVHISSIKSVREVVEDFSLHRIDQRFWFCYHWISFDSMLVCLIALNMSQQNHSNLMISFYNNHHLHYFVRVSSIKSGT